MLLLENRLYTLVSSVQDEKNCASAQFVIRLLPESDIFAAHFPGEPILPGACTLQIVQELAERWLGKPLVLTCIKNLKFLAVINPTLVPVLNISLEQHPDGSIRAQISDNTTVYSKLSIK